MDKITNGEKYKTAKERGEAFIKFCNSHNCSNCPLPGWDALSRCSFHWLDLEYQAELKPCPFCGGTPVLADNVESMRSLTYFVRCACGVRTVSASSESVVVEMWNRRA
jgi:Lar family restriction alleviation protein